jgi:hypothetical protein
MTKITCEGVEVEELIFTIDDDGVLWINIRKIDGTGYGVGLRFREKRGTEK